VLEALNQGMAAAVESVHRSLVHVRVAGRGGGAGTIWHPAGLIVTNAHVVGRGPVQVILPGGRALPAELLAADPECDLAALRIEAQGLAAIPLADSRAVRPGQWVMALGHPFGVQGAATAGVVIGAGAALPEMPPSRRDWLVVSLHLRPGHSGGPMVDAQGRLIGINTMMNGPDVGLAIPVHVTVDFLKGALL
jgi:serine protease Do